MKKLNTVYAMSACFGISALLVGCGGDPATEGEGALKEARLTLGVSDAPLDDARKVVIVFDQLELNGPDGKRLVFAVCDDLDGDNACENGEPPLQVDLLDYQGREVLTLLDDIEVPVGEYPWMRVRILNGDGTDQRSHVIREDGQLLPLEVKRGQGTDAGEIQLDKFVLASGDNAFVVEFDLRRSLVDPQNKNDDSIYLKPRGVRLSNAVEVGHIAGEVDRTLMDNCETAYQSEPKFSHVGYLYPGAIGLNNMDDDADLADDGLTLPLATAAVVFDEASETYHYEFGFVAAGQYSLGYSCVAHNDQPESNETDSDGFVLYSGYGPVTVTAGQTSVQDLTL